MSSTTYCNKCKKQKEKDESWSRIMIWNGIPKEYSDSIGSNTDFCPDCNKEFFAVFKKFLSVK